MKKIFFAVTNDLTYDQRMQRICSTLAENGYEVTLLGRKKASSLPLSKRTFSQKRLSCWFQTGKLFYAEYNLRLLFYLLFKKMDAVCAIDLDTIIPCYWASKFKKIHRVYDAHELFTEQKEVITRPRVHKFWKKIEAKFVPSFSFGYTVCNSIAGELKSRYKVNYVTIRNLPALKESEPVKKKDKFILYQGAVNESRGLEFLIPAMKNINLPLVICGDGNYMQQAKDLITKHELQNSIILKGMLPPEELPEITRQAFIGLNLVENTGLNQYYSLANKYFDYIHAGVPQVSMNFPEYKRINDRYDIALLIDELTPENIVTVINKLINEEALYNRLSTNCSKAKAELNWQKEKEILITFYQKLFNK